MFFATIATVNPKHGSLLKSTHREVDSSLRALVAMAMRKAIGSPIGLSRFLANLPSPVPKRTRTYLRCHGYKVTRYDRVIERVPIVHDTPGTIVTEISASFSLPGRPSVPVFRAA